MQVTKVSFNGGITESESKEYGVDVIVTVSEGEEYCVGTLVWDSDMNDDSSKPEKEWILWRGEGYTDGEYIKKHFGGSMSTEGVGYGDSLQYAEDCINEDFMSYVDD